MKRKIGMGIILLFMLITSGCGNDNVENSVTDGQDTGVNQQDRIAEDTEEVQDEDIAYGELAEGDEAPDFTAELADGSTFTLSNQKGKVVLLNFWATWCGPCVNEMPAFERLHSEYGDEVAILAVNCLEEKETVNRFIADENYTFPIAYDVEGSINGKYPSDGIPYTLIIDKEGVVKKIYVGAADAETQYQEYKSAIEEVK